MVGKHLLTNWLSFIHFPSFVSQNEPNQKKPSCGRILSLCLLFLPVSSFILPGLYVETVYKISFSNYIQVIHSDDCRQMAPLTCFHVSNSLCQQREEENQNAESWGWQLIMTPTGGCSKELRSDTRCAGFVALCFNLAKRYMFIKVNFQCLFSRLQGRSFQISQNSKKQART